mgnify:FL=1
MTAFARCCSVCGGRALPHSDRCAEHAVPAPTSCRVCPRRAVAGRRYCAEHEPTETQRLKRAPYRAHYSSSTYVRNRAMRYRLAGGRCETPGCGVTLGRDWECDHVVPLLEGGSDEIENLRCRCRACHRAKTRADRAARKRSWTQRRGVNADA